MYNIIISKYKESIIMIFIFTSSILLILDNPLNDPSGDFTQIIAILDYLTTAIFTLESIVKIIVFGFGGNGDKSYIKD